MQHKSTDTFVYVVQNTADARMDYYLTERRAKEVGLPTIHVYNTGVQYYDPHGKYFPERVM
jgi:hypothetical protein